MSTSKNRSPLLMLWVGVSLVLPAGFTNCAEPGFEISSQFAEELGSVSPIGGDLGGNPPGSGNPGGPGNPGTTPDPDPVVVDMVQLLSGDPLAKYAWHLNNTGQKVFASQAGVAGADLNMKQTLHKGYTGKGVRVVVSDDGVEDVHEDLNSNFLYGSSIDFPRNPNALAQNAPPSLAVDGHGTSVSGIIAAVANNNLGSRGIASGAKIISYNFLADGYTPTNSGALRQLQGDHGVYNMSWGYTQNGLPRLQASWEEMLEDRTTNGRGALGSVYVKSAGNDYTVACFGESKNCMGSSVFDGDNNVPQIIVAGALNAKGDPASYSSPGSVMWVTAYAGEFGFDSPAIMTTDRSGCSAGYSKSTSGAAFEKGNSENSSCNYTSTFNGTSSSAPVVTGSVAVLLEANPNLTWRDVKYVLAATARPINSNATAQRSTHPLNLALPAGSIYEYGIVTNQAGFKFHNRTGFGAVDIDAAVRLATTNYVSPFTKPFSKGALIRKTEGIQIPDNSSAGVTFSSMVSENKKIEAVRVSFNIVHERLGDLSVELVSPSGTRSRILNPRSSLHNMKDFRDEKFISNAFYMENSVGEWKLIVRDNVTDKVGTVTNWTLQFFGQDQ